MTSKLWLTPKSLLTRIKTHRCLTTSACRRQADVQLPASADVVVIGGGVIGASTAYHLARRGVRVVLLERHKLTSGTTWHSAAVMNSLRGDIHEAKLVAYTKDLLSTRLLENETGVATGWAHHGGLSVTRCPERMKEFERWHALGQYYGAESCMVTPAEIEKLHPLINSTGLLGGIYSPSDGYLDPTGWTNCLAKAAKMHGATVVEDAPLKQVIIENSSVRGVECPQGTIATNKIVLAAGGWSRQIARSMSVPVTIPTMVNKHSYLVTDIVHGISEYPNVRFSDESIYFKAHNDTMYLGAFEANPTFVQVEPDLVFGMYDLDWDAYMPYLEKHMELMPNLRQFGHRTVICGPETFTPDGMPIFGQVTMVDGLFVNCGMCSRGMQLSGGMGREMANLIIDGTTEVDMFSFHINRFQRRYVAQDTWRKESTHEAEVRVYWVPYPTQQRLGGRNLRMSPIHDRLKKRGAFYVATGSGGFERPAFFLPEFGDTLQVPHYDWYGHYNHQKRVEPSPYESILKEYAGWTYSSRVSGAIRNEVDHCRNKVSMFDMSSFGKIRVYGPEAMKALEWLCTAPINRPVGTTVYTLMLNVAGGIEADITVTRTDEEDFYLVIGAGFTRHLRTRLIRLTKGLFDLDIDDQTDAFGVLSIQGPQSRQLLAKYVTNGNELSDGNFPTYTCRTLHMNCHDGIHNIRTIKMSYVGELGYEIHAKSVDCLAVYDTLVNDTEFDIGMAGYEALNTMSLEKGHHHWHADIESTDTPAEAGMMWACKMKSGVDFFGRDALVEQGKHSLKKRLATFTVDPEVPLNGTETIYRDGQLVGYLRRGSFAYTLNRGIGTGYVDMKDKINNVPVSDYVRNGRYQLNVMGKLVDAKVHLKAIYDPENQKLATE